jgi:hypothetical protein
MTLSNGGSAEVVNSVNVIDGAMRRKDLSKTEKLVLLTILSYGCCQAEVKVGVSTLMKGASLRSRAGVFKAVAGLEKKGMIERRPNSGGVSTYVPDAAAILHSVDNGRALSPSPPSAKVRRKVFEKTDGFCHYCAVALTTDKGRASTFQVDHVVPRSKGGTNALSNLVPVCAVCNTTKGTMSVSDFMRDRV